MLAHYCPRNLSLLSMLWFYICLQRKIMFAISLDNTVDNQHYLDGVIKLMLSLFLGIVGEASYLFKPVMCSLLVLVYNGNTR